MNTIKHPLLPPVDQLPPIATDPRQINDLAALLGQWFRQHDHSGCESRHRERVSLDPCYCTCCQTKHLLTELGLIALWGI